MKEPQVITPSETVLTSQIRRSTRKCSCWWWVLVGVICVVGIFLIVLFTTDLKYILFSKPASTPPITRQNVTTRNVTRQDIYGNYSEPGVIVFLMNNKTDEPLCYSAGSALLSGFPVVVAGYDMPFNGFLSKFDYMERAIENAGLKPDDVILVTDSDTLFMGLDMYFLPFIISMNSPATPGELNALAVRQKFLSAPFIVSSEASCNAPDVFYSPDECVFGYETHYQKIRKYNTIHPEHKHITYCVFPYCYLNTGIVLARVWAYKEFIEKARNLTRTQKPPVNPTRGWNDEQSVYTALYLDLVTWEVEHDVFSKPLHERQAARSPYGLRAGFIEIDHSVILHAVTSPTQLSQYMMNDLEWSKYLPSGGSEHSHTQNITDIWNVSRFVKRLFKRAYYEHGGKIYTRKVAPGRSDRWWDIMSENISYTPPIFMRNLSFSGRKTNGEPIFIPIFHSPDYLNGLVKWNLKEVISICAQWFVPMVYDKNAKDKAVWYLESMPLFVSTHNSIIRDSYHAKCGFPYERVIKEVIGITGQSSEANNN